MKIICRRCHNGNVHEFTIVENITNGYEAMLLQPLIESNIDPEIEYLLVPHDHRLYTYVSEISG